MSMQRECLIYKARDSKWYMLLARQEYGDLDKADHFGPYNSLNDVNQELRKHPNPGGETIDSSGTRMPSGKRGAK